MDRLKDITPELSYFNSGFAANWELCYANTVWTWQLQSNSFLLKLNEHLF
jgi:hypothetical protein